MPASLPMRAWEPSCAINESPLVATQKGYNFHHLGAVARVPLGICSRLLQDLPDARSRLFPGELLSACESLVREGLTQPLVVHDAVDPPRQGLHIIRIDQHGGLPYDLR